MESSVRRSRHQVGRHDGRTTLAQTFRFGGVTAASIGEVLRSAPLVGPDSLSIFGERPGEELPDEAGTRRLRGFSPAPGFRFDVTLAELSEIELPETELPESGSRVFLVSFSQSDLRTPYLQGDAVWMLSDGAAEIDGAVFDEEINTERALAAGASPLMGPKPSLRRWLFFRVGHSKVMTDATVRIARLAST